MLQIITYVAYHAAPNRYDIFMHLRSRNPHSITKDTYIRIPTNDICSQTNPCPKMPEPPPRSAPGFRQDLAALCTLTHCSSTAPPLMRACFHALSLKASRLRSRCTSLRLAGPLSAEAGVYALPCYIWFIGIPCSLPGLKCGFLPSQRELLSLHHTVIFNSPPDSRTSVTQRLTAPPLPPAPSPRGCW